ncbi:PQQ-dependent sugar dehydrogenase [Streptomyces sulphureus]|uniref:PQQ-dependent sugar dehydrogenase n=1 Tax=Streptomyces sulphureus TaxID=47758 RepID=UPI00037E091E|nr:PQQ-dependent sugar dehydrogenase [Streptomyces sulphureus]
MRRSRATAALAAALTTQLLLSGCSSDSGDGESSPSPSASGEGSADASPSGSAAPAKGDAEVVETLTKNLEAPWGLAELGDGDLLVTERDSGKVLRVDGESGEKTEAGTVPGVAAAGEGGLLGVAVPPGDDRSVYVYFTTESDNRIARLVYDPKKDEGNQLGAPDTVLKGIPKGTTHNGGRIAFGPDKMLYAGTGEGGRGDEAQDRESLGGKILRMTPDGEPPGQGNPEADSVVYSWGHRNVQGFDWDSGKRLWASEFGQDDWDELNLIQPGKNYGWPEVEGKADERGYVDPIEQWKPSEASPSGLAVAEGSVWMAGLRGERLWRIPLDGTKAAAEPQSFFKGKYGRLRTVAPAGKDGLWLVTSETDSRGTPSKGDDRILRLKVR